MKWQQADRISDAIVDLLREEVKAPDMHPLEMLAGQLLAFKAYLASAPNARPAELRAFEQAVDACLAVLQRWGRPSIPQSAGRDTRRRAPDAPASS